VTLMAIASWSTRSLRNGGTFVVKGIKSLDTDMSSALTAALMSEPAAP